jgi:hypothetical protein
MAFLAPCSYLGMQTSGSCLLALHNRASEELQLMSATGGLQMIQHPATTWRLALIISAEPTIAAWLEDDDGVHARERTDASRF